MKEKLGDLVPWVEKLEVTLVKPGPNDDRDEVERRARLARFASCPLPLILAMLISHDRDLEDIGKRSFALSEKGKVARALDKTRDSGEVVKLIEKLRQAILVYQVSISNSIGVVDRSRAEQVSQQRSIYHQLTQLTVSSYLSSWPPRLNCFLGGQSSFDAVLKLHQVREHACDLRHRITRY